MNDYLPVEVVDFVELRLWRQKRLETEEPQVLQQQRFESTAQEALLMRFDLQVVLIGRRGVKTVLAVIGVYENPETQMERLVR